MEVLNNNNNAFFFWVPVQVLLLHTSKLQYRTGNPTPGATTKLSIRNQQLKNAKCHAAGLDPVGMQIYEWNIGDWENVRQMVIKENSRKNKKEPVSGSR